MVQDPTLTIRDLLDDNWNTSNTSVSYKPAIHTGWIDTTANQPQITVTSATESASGRETPFSGIDPSGAGPIQTIVGTLKVNCWSNREAEGRVNPKKLTYEFSEEVKRILKANVTGATDLRYIGYMGRTLRVEEESESVWFRYDISVWYVYCERP